MSRIIGYDGATSDGPSKALWWDCENEKIMQDPGRGYGFFDEFLSVQTGVTTEVHQGYYVFKDSNGTLKGTTVAGGEVALFGTTDNDEVCMARSGALLSAPYVVAAASSSGKKLWFEARIKRSVITDAKGGFFVGLADQTACANEFMVDAGDDFSDVDLLGFWGDETDDSVGSHVHIITQKTSAAFDTVLDTAATMEADTYMKLGFRYDPESSDPAKRIAFFVDGVELGTYVGEASGDATVYIQDTTNFPGGEGMAPIIGLKNAHGDDFTVTMDWWTCYQLR